MKLSRFAAGMYAFAGLSGLLSVALAALAAHALASIAPAGDQAVVWFKEATAFQATHTLAMILVVTVAERVDEGLGRRLMRISAWLLAAAVVLFPGALYSISFGGPVFTAPFGGISAMAGWALFGVGAWLARSPESHFTESPATESHSPEL